MGHNQNSEADEWEFFISQTHNIFRRKRKLLKDNAYIKILAEYEGQLLNRARCNTIAIDIPYSLFWVLSFNGR